MRPRGDVLESRSLLTLTPIAAAVNLVAGPPATVRIGSFLDSNSAVAGDFQAVIDWGDGHSSAGVVQATPTAGRFDVMGSNSYASAKTYPVKIQVTKYPGEATEIDSEAFVAAPAVALSPVATVANFTAGMLPADPVSIGSFTSTNATAKPTDFTATIAWGDGNSSAANVSGTSTPGLFLVRGANLYSKAGNYPVSVTVQDASGNRTTILSTAVVGPPTSLHASGMVAQFTAGVSPSATVPALVGGFTSSDLTAQASAFAASIDWGDGTSSAGTVAASPDTPGLFLVSGTNAYATAGPYPIKIAVSGPGGVSLVINSQATVTAAPAPVFSGGLANLIVNGPFAPSGYTNTNRPTFAGDATPFAIVNVYARNLKYDAQIPLGQAVADSGGRWTLVSTPLARGAYSVTATSTIPKGTTSTPSVLSNADGSQVVHVAMQPAAAKGHRPARTHPARSRAARARPTLPARPGMRRA
ncbi:hypothetical protein OJF2_32380 [Aquisphaera giovannonii]|uniref:Bacterial Ig-like domain-containing protein n=2 Tax=Aquisphaera giovannonii TaxID=406548 RepID=A0A5B9W366_9BACT|nr:hypothetical protein OJF2_32380 [Aquisphaera giovannonii]